MIRPSKLLAGAACIAALVIPACVSGGYGPGYGGIERSEVVVHEGENYSGTAQSFDGAVPDFVEYRLNDAISSIRINSGSWEVCTDANFRGRCEVLTSSTPSLRALQMNNNISSMRPVDGYGYPPGQAGPGYGSLTLFSQTGLRGDALTVNRDEPNLSRAGFNDRARSVDVRSGVWAVCADGNYLGRCVTLDRPVSDLRDAGLSGSISSVRLLPDNRHRRGY
ncbi:MAG: beta/gamma crystallin family protein [Hyphomonas sp.]|uniref:beta/gamma crystallin-related protein n=1 Tax=Hyphomonas sp. TaxID=87 RepID=UPI001795B728|nr:beta/gamma crystallin-related protein [Hyphomonas sp.]MBA3070503.1 beta/gamma crystallin family protein [Hyphomonas sp.]MBU3921014.1 beta/gamma crystallin family protein [Alphaproteobacteria bacterium]MBU4062033.1 beta/gamma crystallin family protein [Alphaproteobacteria bacterium]MBU4164969.1 beta/gamma crystallin family protein [Alphaproteobacteria bacterium]